MAARIPHADQGRCARMHPMATSDRAQWLRVIQMGLRAPQEFRAAHRPRHHRAPRRVREQPPRGRGLPRTADHDGPYQPAAGGVRRRMDAAPIESPAWARQSLRRPPRTAASTTRRWSATRSGCGTSMPARRTPGHRIGVSQGLVDPVQLVGQVDDAAKRSHQGRREGGAVTGLGTTGGGAAAGPQTPVPASRRYAAPGSVRRSPGRPRYRRRRGRPGRPRTAGRPHPGTDCGAATGRRSACPRRCRRQGKSVSRPRLANWLNATALPSRPARSTDSPWASSRSVAARTSSPGLDRGFRRGAGRPRPEVVLFAVSLVHHQERRHRPLGPGCARTSAGPPRRPARPR